LENINEINKSNYKSQYSNEKKLINEELCSSDVYRQNNIKIDEESDLKMLIKNVNIIKEKHLFEFKSINGDIILYEQIPKSIFNFTNQAYLRFLRGCNKDVNLASQRMINHIQFRITWQIWLLK